MKYFVLQLILRTWFPILCIALFFVLPALSHAQGTAPTVVDADESGVGAWIFAFFYHVVMQIGGFAVWLAGIAFDAAVNNFVRGMGEWMLGNIGIAVEEVWVIIRDVFNMLFIFALVFIGLKLIWNADDSGAKRALGSLIVAALLINFSLFFAKFIVDFSNIAAIQIFNLMAETVNTTASVFPEGATLPTINIESPESVGIHAMFMQLVGLQALGGAEAIDQEGYRSFGYLLMILVFMLTSAAVFLAGAIMLTIRFISLVIYMMFSPFMFLGMILPKFQGYTSKWWSGFLNQAFFAPAYFFMIFIAFKVLIGFHAQAFEAGSTYNLNKIALNPEETGNDVPLSILFYLIALGFMVGAIVVSKKMGAGGASMSLNAMQSVQRRLVGGASSLVGGGSSFVGRNTLGRIGDPDTRVGKAVARANARLSTSNSAGARVGRVALGAVGLTARTRQQAIDATASAKYGGKQSRNDVNTFEKKQNIRNNQVLAEQTREVAFAEHLAGLEDNTRTVGELDTSLRDLATTIREMSNSERANLDVGQLTNGNVAINLTDAQITSLEGSGNFSNEDINAIRAARRTAQNNVAQFGTASVVQTGGTAAAPIYEATNTALRTGGTAVGHQTTQRQRLLAGGDAVVGTLSVDALIRPEMIGYITPRIIEARMKNGINENERIRLMTAVLINAGGLVPPPGGSPTVPPGPWANWANNSVYGSEFFR